VVDKSFLPFDIVEGKKRNKIQTSFLLEYSNRSSFSFFCFMSLW